ncbi:hypothetical protein KR038_005767 [Drosophila bunnanda]|nr:hypothetical protein KR038_005767 [Drosophila bunnanda]
MLHHNTVPTTSSLRLLRGRGHRRPQPNRFQEHLQRLERATSRVDQRPPRLQALQLNGLGPLSQDARIFLQRTNENAHLLLNLSRIMRTGGSVGHLDDRSPKSLSSLPHMMRRVEELQRQNDCIGRRLMSIHARRRRRRRESDDHPRPDAELSQELSQITTQSYLPDSMSDVFRDSGCALKLPADSGELLRLLRPRIVLYFGLMDGRSLGRVVLQLYTEAAPLVVLQFIRTCQRQRPHEFAVRRVFPNLWLEGYLLGCNKQRELSADPPPLLRDPMEFDTRVLSHERHNCVLSCSKEYCVHGFPGGAINFSISFKPLPAANGQRVAFGRVVRGAKVIASMQLYGTKNGKMIRPLVITHCDVL